MPMHLPKFSLSTASNIFHDPLDARTGCIVLLYGQNEFREEATDTLDYVVNQSDFTIQTLRNVTDYLSFAMTINVAALYLPSDVQAQINNLKVDLNKAADTISLKTTESYKRIRKVLHNVYVSNLSFLACRFCLQNFTEK